MNLQRYDYYGILKRAEPGEICRRCGQPAESHSPILMLCDPEHATSMEHFMPIENQPATMGA
jgi:hypothetical protein